MNRIKYKKRLVNALIVSERCYFRARFGGMGNNTHMQERLTVSAGGHVAPGVFLVDLTGHRRGMLALHLFYRAERFADRGFLNPFGWFCK